LDAAEVFTIRNLGKVTLFTHFA